MMYFETYEQAKEAAVKQSIGRLVDCKLYVKIDGVIRVDEDGEYFQSANPTRYKIGFTPDNPKDAYIYNGELKND